MEASIFRRASAMSTLYLPHDRILLKRLLNCYVYILVMWDLCPWVSFFPPRQHCTSNGFIKVLSVVKVKKNKNQHKGHDSLLMCCWRSWNPPPLIRAPPSPNFLVLQGLIELREHLKLRVPDYACPFWQATPIIEAYNTRASKNETLSMNGGCGPFESFACPSFHQKQAL